MVHATAGDASALARLRDGRWRSVEPGLVGWLALVAGAADVVTTWRVLADPGRVEGNVFIAAVADAAPLLGVALLATTCGAMVAICWLDLGWASPVSGWGTVVVHGVGGGLHNVVAYRSGFYLNSVLREAVALDAVYPVLGALVGLTAARREFGTLPPAEVCAVVGSCLLYHALVPVP